MTSFRSPELTRREIALVVDRLIAAAVDSHEGTDAWIDSVLGDRCSAPIRRRIKRAFRERMARYRNRNINL